MNDDPRRPKRFGLGPRAQDKDNAQAIHPPPRATHLPHPRLAPPGMAGAIPQARPDPLDEARRSRPSPAPAPSRTEQRYPGLERFALSQAQSAGDFGAAAKPPLPRKWDRSAAKQQVVFIPHPSRAPAELTGKRLKAWIEAQRGRPTDTAAKVFKPLVPRNRNSDRDIER